MRRPAQQPANAHYLPCLVLLYCAACAGEENELARAPQDAMVADSTEPVDAGEELPVSIGPRGPVQTVAKDCDVCCVGEVMPCACSDGAQGFSVCTSRSGTFTPCSCLTVSSQAPGGTIAVPPPPPAEPLQCGDTHCLTYSADTHLSPTACCTEQGTCGAQQSFLFGVACVAQNIAAPIPSQHPGCPDEFPTWLDLIGCCTPQGSCGLYFQGMAGWSWGCVERTEMARLLNAGSSERDMLAKRQGLREPPRPDYRKMSCTP
jgi:hypothetical protein